MSPGKKIYILDTNVLIHDPLAIYSFGTAEVGIPEIVLEELDKFKEAGSDVGRNSRESIRILDKLRAFGSLGEGVHMESGGILKVVFIPEDEKNKIKFPFHLDSNDNQILLTAFYYKIQGYTVKFISKDLNSRVKADVLGIESEDYLRGRVSEDKFYKGWLKYSVPSSELKVKEPGILSDIAEEKELVLNKFIWLESNNNPQNYRVFRYLGQDKFLAVSQPQLKWPLGPRNPQQLMAMDLLLDDNVQMVNLAGPAGTGKTFLALLAGLHKVLVEDDYEKMLISRPVIPLGPDIGYLPGDVSEKLHSWMQPIYDNVDLIIHSAEVAKHFGEELNFGDRARLYKEIHSKEFHKQARKARKKGDKYDKGDKYAQFNKRDKHETEPEWKIHSVDELVRHKKLSLEAITYMRGRSIPYQYILIDEVQNLSPHEVKTLVSRVGEGSKIILCGDPYQIDSPYLNFSSNGLIVSTDRFKGQKIFGTVFLENSERSELSKLAAELM
ncbi:MAG: PhoH family protein [candidate division TM6 bacterium GW2011_GWF2_32_72]|nr:MAG: PhoH family protein [candidate division TM6 bacterium GW2011_GWF2_32_72]